MSNSNTKFQASLIENDWKLCIRISTVKWEFTSRLVIGTHSVCTVTWKTIHGWNSRVPWKPTVKRQKRRHSNTAYSLLCTLRNFCCENPGVLVTTSALLQLPPVGDERSPYQVPPSPPAWSVPQLPLREMSLAWWQSAEWARGICRECVHLPSHQCRYGVSECFA